MLAGWRTTIKSEIHARLCVLAGWRTTIKLAIRGGGYRCGVKILLLNFTGCKMKKEEAYRIILECADQYKTNLVNCHLLFIFQDVGTVQWLEAICLPRNYRHLTGINLTDNRLKSVDFYEMCIDKKLSPSAFEMKKDGTTKMKLSVLSQVMNIHKTAKMIGNFNAAKSLLVTDKLVGTITACMGFVREHDKSNLYIPNTVLCEDMRNITEKPTMRMLAIFRKPKSVDIYNECTYLAKGVPLDCLLLDNILKQKVMLDNKC